MPIYEYECDHCGAQTELVQKFSDPPATECPHCGEHKLNKLVSAAAFHLKGSGWYETDFKGKPKQTEDKKQDNSTKKDDNKKTASVTKDSNSDGKQKI